MARFVSIAILAALVILGVSAQDLSTMSNPNSDWSCAIQSTDLSITGNTNSNPHDPSHGEPFCNAANTMETEICLGRCCQYDHQCADSSCVNVWNLPNSFNCNSGNQDCSDIVECGSNDGCIGSSTVHCFGRIACKASAPAGACAAFLALNSFVEGDLCLVDGNSDNYKICSPNRPHVSSSSSGPESFVVGDPQFVGLRGQSFQIHGVAGEVYNIVSDADLQYNSRFVFLDRGDCPVVNGKKQKGCFAHAGSYLGELGLKTRFGDKIHYASGSAANGFTSVEVNGKQIEMGETIYLAGDIGFVSLNSTHLSSIKVGNWQFDFENSDMFINQRVAVSSPSKLRSHGLLGQTWKQVTYPNAIKYIQGEVDDYVIRGREIFGDEFVYNSFN